MRRRCRTTQESPTKVTEEGQMALHASLSLSIFSYMPGKDHSARASDR